MRALARDQEMQAVLHVMGYSLGRHGLDGKIGSVTRAAMQQFAEDHGMKAAGLEDIKKSLLAKMKDPSFRQDALDKLANEPQTKDNIKAMQWNLAEAGHSDLYMRDPVTRLMTGRMNDQTENALKETEHGKPTATAYVQMGIPEETVKFVMSSRNAQFAESAHELTRPQEVAARDSAPALNVAKLDM